ncbi:MAG: DUF6273 domain-containing protein, partial [Bacilli bacterium]
MNVKRRNFVFGTMCLLSVLTLPVTLFGNKTELFNGILASENPYSIVFETSKNKLAVGAFNPTGYSGSGVATTELGNEVAFDYSLLINPTSNWQTILEGGFFTNINPIHGMEQITINKSDTTASVKVYWSNISIFSEGQCEVFAAATDSFTCTFDEYKPNYIKVVAIGASLNIENMEIEFSCSDENPLEGGGSKTVLMGMYPQSMVTDATLLSTLNSARGTLPTSSNSQSWTSYGYYISGSVSSYMWYIDIRDETDGYRGVYFTSYRPYYTTTSSDTYQDDNGYNTSSVYWFKYEPITWRVLDVQSNRAFLMADLVLDSQDYHYSTSERTIGGSTVYANNYKESHILSWLNDNFYNTAFTAAEKARIQTTTVDNSVASTGYDPNAYACANTSDKVFLLSYAEATSATYGLSTDASRQLQPSAYAQSQGVYTYTSNGNSNWWLRSPYSDGANRAR